MKYRSNLIIVLIFVLVAIPVYLFTLPRGTLGQIDVVPIACIKKYKDRIRILKTKIEQVEKEKIDLRKEAINQLEKRHKLLEACVKNRRKV